MVIKLVETDVKNNLPKLSVWIDGSKMVRTLTGSAVKQKFNRNFNKD